jgi:hypothetical protein
MQKPLLIALAALTASLLGCTERPTQDIVVAVLSKAGRVDNTSENSDAFIWRKFTELAAPLSSSKPSPVTFETWVRQRYVFSDTSLA